MAVVRFARVEDLTAPDALSAILGPVRSIERVPMSTPGFSAARHERLRVALSSGEKRSLVLKRVWPRSDWTAYRTADTAGREAALLGEPALDGVWQVFERPYRAYAAEEEVIGLLMEDLLPYLPGEGALDPEREERLLRSLAALHARYWCAEALALPWLTALPRRFAILGPRAAEEELRRDANHPLFPLVRRGWEIALTRLPPRAREIVLQTPDEIAGWLAPLPGTLLHGDAKIDNFAFLPEGRVSAFDWAVMGVGPATLDLGYFLAVNWQRTTRTKEEIIALYRRALEEERGERFEDGPWEEMEVAAVLAGSLKLLWSKALGLESGLPGAASEWQWWLDRLASR